MYVLVLGKLTSSFSPQTRTNAQRVITIANSCAVTQKVAITASVTRDTESTLIGSRVKVK